jgi:hypothetical protein
MGGQDSLLQFLVLPARIAPDVAELLLTHWRGSPPRWK